MIFGESEAFFRNIDKMAVKGPFLKLGEGLKRIRPRPRFVQEGINRPPFKIGVEFTELAFVFAGNRISNVFFQRSNSRNRNPQADINQHQNDRERYHRDGKAFVKCYDFP